MNKLKIGLMFSIILNIFFLILLTFGTTSLIKEENYENLVKDNFTDLNALWPSNSKLISQYFDDSLHLGIDIAKENNNEEVYAVLDGLVKKADCNDERGYGCQIILDHNNSLQTSYSHNAELKVKIGENVKKGQLIAIIGTTGRATGSHLHFEVIYKNKNINPFLLLPRNGGSVFIYVYSVSKSIADIKNFLFDSDIQGRLLDDPKFTEKNKKAEINFEIPKKATEQLTKFLREQATDKIIYGEKALLELTSDEPLPDILYVKVILTDVSLLKEE